MDKKISDEFWQEKHNKWTQDLLVIQSNITKYEQANINFIEQGENFIKICNNAKDLYKYGNNTEKKQLLNYVLQNLTIDGENVYYDYKSPFDIFAKGLNRKKILTLVYDFRTFLTSLAA